MIFFNKKKKGPVLEECVDDALVNDRRRLGLGLGVRLELGHNGGFNRRGQIKSHEIGREKPARKKEKKGGKKEEEEQEPGELNDATMSAQFFLFLLFFRVWRRKNF